ncbi:hypothetical protein BH11PSE12_BH11PSE12_29830 [soil metagenome]
MDDLSRLMFTVYRGAREVSFTQFQDFALEQLKIFVDYDRAQWGDSAHDIEYVKNCRTELFHPSVKTLCADIECGAHGKPEKTVFIHHLQDAYIVRKRMTSAEKEWRIQLRSATRG